MVHKKHVLYSFLLLLLTFNLEFTFAQKFNLVIGSLGREKQGFAFSQFDTISGQLSEPKLMTAAVAPCFFVIHPNGRFLYSTVSKDTLPHQMGGALSAYKIDQKTGELIFLNSLASKGKEPCHISLDRTGTHVLAANYSSATAIVCSIAKDGSLLAETGLVKSSGSSINKDRQNEAHAHSILVDPTNKFALVCDLGSDKILIYKYNHKTGKLIANKPGFVKSTPGAGPRHMSFHPNGKYLYVANELISTVSCYEWNAKNGILTETQQISSLPTDFKAFNTLAEIAVYPNGKYLYCTNRGNNTLAVFTIDAKNGHLSILQHIDTKGSKPRNFTFDPSLKWLLLSNHDNNNVVVYKLTPETGKLNQVGEPVKVESPFCLRFLK